MMGGVTEVPGDAPARIEGQEFESPRAVATKCDHLSNQLVGCALDFMLVISSISCVLSRLFVLTITAPLRVLRPGTVGFPVCPHCLNRLQVGPDDQLLAIRGPTTSSQSREDAPALYKRLCRNQCQNVHPASGDPWRRV